MAQCKSILHFDSFHFPVLGNKKKEFRATWLMEINLGNYRNKFTPSPLPSTTFFQTPLPVWKILISTQGGYFLLENDIIALKFKISGLLEVSAAVAYSFFQFLVTYGKKCVTKNSGSNPVCKNHLTLFIGFYEKIPTLSVLGAPRSTS